VVARLHNERTGYPTQKPEALLERIISASSNEGDVVLDPFCGCGTTVAVAQRLKRRWLGIDITHLAINLIKRRLKKGFGPAVDFEVVGEPVDLTGARALAQQDRYQFQWWALDQVDASPAEKKKGSDKGIDGIVYFTDKPDPSVPRRIVVSVKSGAVSVRDVRDLQGVMTRENAELGALLTGVSPEFSRPPYEKNESVSWLGLTNRGFFSCWKPIRNSIWNSPSANA
jgi:hypothetical protein